MKPWNCFVLLLCLLLIQSPVLSQDGTTLEEYNYVTKGLKIQLESGLDTKRGYELMPLDTTSLNNYGSRTEGKIWDLQALLRTSGPEKEIAAYIIRFGYVSGTNVGKLSEGYFCIVRPNSSEEVLRLYRNSLINVTSADKLHAIIFLLNSVVVWDWKK